MHKKNLLLVLVLVLAMSFSGCLSGIFGGKPTTLEVTPNEVEIALDEDTTVELEAVVKDNKGKVMEVKPEEIKWTIDDVEEEVEEAAEEEVIESVATLSKKTGTTVTVTGERVGQAKITVAYDDLSVTVPVVVIATKPADKTALEEAITTAQGLLETVVGEEPGQVSQEAKDALETAVTAATTVKDDADATQEDVDAAVTALNTAIATFEAAIVPEPFIVFENFEGLTDVNEFWTADYKSLPGEEKPMYFKTGGTFSLKDGGLKMADDKGGRFTIGMPEGHEDTGEKIDNVWVPTTNAPAGHFDLSKPYNIVIEFTEATGPSEGTKKFQVYVDNNQTGQDASVHGKVSKIYECILSELPEIIDGVGTITIPYADHEIGTKNSFLQLRVESEAIIVFKSIKVEYTD